MHAGSAAFANKRSSIGIQGSLSPAAKVLADAPEVARWSFWHTNC
jgi:hypothetical protein